MYSNSNLGQSAKDAARIATNTFLSYLDSRHADMLSIRSIPTSLCLLAPFLQPTSPPPKKFTRFSTPFVFSFPQSDPELFYRRDVGRLVLRAFSEAHEKILKSHADIWESGTTTMLAGMIVELDTEEPTKGRENGYSNTHNGDEKDSSSSEKEGKDQEKEKRKETEKEKEKEKETGNEKCCGNTKWVFVGASVGTMTPPPSVHPNCDNPNQKNKKLKTRQ